MIVLLILAALCILGIILYKFTDFEMSGSLLAMASGTILIIMLLAWPISHFGYKSQIQQYHVTKQSIERSRKNELSELERAALTNKIIELNRGLADAKYWKGTIMGIYIPDEIMELDYLE